jgi:hypothetical protein
MLDRAELYNVDVTFSLGLDNRKACRAEKAPLPYAKASTHDSSEDWTGAVSLNKVFTVKTGGKS